MYRGTGPACAAHRFPQTSIASPERLAKRTRRRTPFFSSNRKPTLVGTSSRGSISARFDKWIGASKRSMPAGFPCDFPPVADRNIQACHHGALVLADYFRDLAPGGPVPVPKSRRRDPPFATSQPSSENLRRERNYPHQLPGAKLAHNRAENACPDRAPGCC